MVILDSEFLLSNNSNIDSILSIHKNIMKNAAKHIFNEIGHTKLIETHEFIKNHLELEINLDQLLIILQMFPSAKAEIIEFGISDTACRDSVSDAVSLFYLGCNWPTYGKKTDMEIFTQLLKKQQKEYNN